MDLLYRLFYTAFSLGVITAFMVPVIVLLRLLLNKAPKKYIVYMWIILFFRGICPVSMSSPICLQSSWNRAFHRMLLQLGLNIFDETGIMKSWRSVFINDISADTSYMVCTMIWCAGMAGLCIFTLLRQRKISSYLKNSKKIYEKIYQSDNLKSPVMTGVFRLKRYIPSSMRVDDVKYLLYHFESHSKRKDGIIRFFAFIVLVIQWFNPLIWIAYYLLNVDIEMAADEAVVKKFGIGKAKEYAQEIFNLKEYSFKGNQSLFTFDEKFIRPRAFRLIYMKEKKRQYTVLSFVILFLCLVWSFLLRPLQILWNGETWKIESDSHSDNNIFNDKEENVVASINTVSPDGLQRVIYLVMTDGIYDKAEGYTGSFSLKLSDSYGADLDETVIDYTFGDVENGKLHFDSDTKLYVYDYNDDGTNEIVIGQQTDVSDERWKEITGDDKKDKEVLNEYYLWNIGSTSLKKVSDAVYFGGGKEDVQEFASRQFEIPEKTTRVFISEISGKNIYYVWDIEKEKYVRKELSEDDMEIYRTDYEGKESEAGELNTHTLKNGSTITAEVKTRKDETGNEIIKEIILNPETSSRKMKAVTGYYCDIQWVMAADDEKSRFAVLTYNGTKSQTFVIYDVKEEKIYYEHEDGNGILGTVFSRYNGNDVEFDENGLVVYTLMEKDEDKLKIGFAADTKSGITVNGNYFYDVETENISDLSYAQNTVQE